MNVERDSITARASSLLVWLIVGVCCVLPLAWIAWQVIQNPNTWRESRIDQFRFWLLWRTVAFNGGAGIIATLLGIPAAIVLGRGRGWVATLLWFVLPVSLLLPSITYAYGWSQFVRILGLRWEFFRFDPAGGKDVARCVWTLATWLWALPAGIIGLSLRRVDTQVQQQALLDGVLWRVTLRQVAGPIVASIAMATILAVQEFAVYEPTGISVVATEVRMVFETGAFSSPDNPITAPMATQGIESLGLADQGARAAAAVATSLPLLLVVLLLAAIAFRFARRLSLDDNVETGAWPRSLEAGRAVKFGAMVILIITVLVPTISLIASHKGSVDPSVIWKTFSPQVTGSVIVASISGAVGLGLGLLAIVRRHRFVLGAALASFFVGGQMLAIAQIRLYNRPGLSGAIYDAWPIVVITYIARFGWVVLLAASVAWSRSWRELRDMASSDGASATQSARWVIAPLAWPILGAGAVLVMSLSLVEVPATVLLSPQRPQMLIPMLMTWVHMLRYDAMIEGSLLMIGMVLALTVIATLLLRLGARFGKVGPHGYAFARRVGIILLFSMLLIGCDHSTQPDAIWCETGTGPAQVVYPRGITYSSIDDTFFIVDKMARVQHLDRAGHCLNEWRMPQWQHGKPVGLSVGPDGNVYVPDTHYARVMVFSPKGKYLRQWGSMGKEPGQFVYPTDVAFDSLGRIFVSEYGDNDRVQVFDDQGNFLYTFGHFGNADGEFSRPQSMVIDGDLVYITDACNHRIVVFKTDGTFVRNMGRVGSGLGEFRFPYGLDEDVDGHLIVCEFGNNRVQLIDKETGRGLKTWGVGGREPGQLAYPWGVAVDRKDRIVAVDAGNNRLQVFEF